MILPELRIGIQIYRVAGFGSLSGTRCYRHGILINEKEKVFLYKVRSILFDELKLDARLGVATGQTAGGLKSTGEAVLKKLADLHPLPGEMITPVNLKLATHEIFLAIITGS